MDNYRVFFLLKKAFPFFQFVQHFFFFTWISQSNMFCASDERIVLGSKENLDENMANFSLKVIEKKIFHVFEEFFVRCKSFFFERENIRYMYVCMYVTKRYESLVSLRGKIFRANNLFRLVSPCKYLFYFILSYHIVRLRCLRRKVLNFTLSLNMRMMPFFPLFLLSFFDSLENLTNKM